MRFLTADFLYPLHTSPKKEGVLQISDKGEVIAILENKTDIPKEKLEVFEGILCPGFVNAHCHLELSHLLGIAKKGRGFLDFVGAIKKRDAFSKLEIQEAIERAEMQMIINGIVAVGDICNTTDTLLQKQKANLYYYNFIETFQVHEDMIEQTIKDALQIRNEFRQAKMKATIVPHSPFSVPPNLTEEIANTFDEDDELLTVHLQETKAENQLFENKSGILFDWLQKMKANTEIWEKREKSTDVLEEIVNRKILIVHNTFAKKKDITDNYYCTCPKANLYIENTLPDYSIFNTDKLCIGTDSLASNNSLSILEELQIIQENTIFDLNTLLKMASKNGAEAMGFENLGTFEKGKIPGVNLIKSMDGMKFTDWSFIEKLN